MSSPLPYDQEMPRWEAGAQARLTQAAYELYIERGFEHVTVAEIAERAGLTKRTFFRYFDDKREVLFSGASAFQEAVVDAVANAPHDVAPIDAVVAALAAAGSGITEIGEGARARQRLIESSSDLHEREMIKMVALKDAIEVALQTRGVEGSGASLTAQAGVAVFQTAFERWAHTEGSADFPSLIDGALDDLRTGDQSSGPPSLAAPTGNELNRTRCLLDASEADSTELCSFTFGRTNRSDHHALENGYTAAAFPGSPVVGIGVPSHISDTQCHCTNRRRPAGRTTPTRNPPPDIESQIRVELVDPTELRMSIRINFFASGSGLGI